MRHIFWSMWNAQVIAQSRGWFRCLPSPRRHHAAIITNQKKWRVAGAGHRHRGLCAGWCREKVKSIMMIKYIAIEFVQARQIGLKANTILGTGWWNSKRIKLRWSDSDRRLGGPLSASATPRMRDPECCRDSKHRRDRGTAVIQRKYRSSEVYKSIAIATIYRNAPR